MVINTQKKFFIMCKFSPSVRPIYIDNDLFNRCLFIFLYEHKRLITGIGDVILMFDALISLSLVTTLQYKQCLSEVKNE
jgi:hypothetical protein